MNFHYRDISKKTYVTLQNTESRKTVSRVRSLKQFSFQSLPKSRQTLRCCGVNCVPQSLATQNPRIMGLWD